MNEALLYTFEAGGMRVLRIVLVVLAVVSLTICAILIALEPQEWEASAFTAAALLLTYAFIWAILPARYELSRSYLGIVFPWKTWRVSLESVERVRAGNWWEAYGYWGMRFASSPGHSVVIQRKHPHLFTRPNLVISPRDRVEFLRAFDSLNAGIEVSSVR